ncbi:MAG: hypothetical protein M1826_001699 [Phylliscum demangeonii]|nr:MAG: hypothetical protein M1826_001699 [Phylliscum demangeonii]
MSADRCIDGGLDRDRAFDRRSLHNRRRRNVRVDQGQGEADLRRASAGCAVLRWRLTDQVVFADDSAYTSSESSYWSAQANELRPACIVRPLSSQDVSRAVTTLTTVSQYAAYLGGRPCQFAVRGGGHTPFAGSASIDRGVTIDLSLMKDVTVSAGQTITSIGPGARWGDVYRKLDALNLAVAGGRIADVGVAGLTTGGVAARGPAPTLTVDGARDAAGGLSFFAPRFGLVCDNVENFEVVLASGAIVRANARERPDLWFALKGGSNNFGIVTRFDLRTFPHGRMWGGVIGYRIEDRRAQFQALEAFNGAEDYDVYGTVINNYSFGPDTGWLVANSFEYTRPEAYPAALRPWTDLQPQTFNSMRLTNLTDITVEMGGRTTNLYRKLFVTSTVGNSAALLERIFDLHDATAQQLRDCRQLSWSLSLQPLPATITSRAAATGGNPLGLAAVAAIGTAAIGTAGYDADPRARNGSAAAGRPDALVLTLLTVFWGDAADDDRIERAARDTFARADAVARDMGLARDWIYLNYAASWQDPFAGYGEPNRARLQQISRVYDPNAVFQTMVPGGFKLFR